MVFPFFLLMERSKNDRMNYQKINIIDDYDRMKNT